MLRLLPQRGADVGRAALALLQRALRRSAAVLDENDDAGGGSDTDAASEPWRPLRHDVEAAQRARFARKKRRCLKHESMVNGIATYFIDMPDDAQRLRGGQGEVLRAWMGVGRTNEHKIWFALKRAPAGKDAKVHSTAFPLSLVSPVPRQSHTACADVPAARVPAPART